MSTYKLFWGGMLAKCMQTIGLTLLAYSLRSTWDMLIPLG